LPVRRLAMLTAVSPAADALYVREVILEDE
jgi:hypothetical protein